MSQIVNTNIASLNAQSALGKSQSAIEVAMQRLSTGLRINSAKDDAIGLATSIRLDSQIRGLNQSVKNANDGVSLFQTAEASLTEITNLLQRIRELSVQASSSISSSADRATLQLEVTQLSNQLDTIANNTDFNGKKLLDGSADQLSFQIGSSSSDTVNFSIDSVTTKDLNFNNPLGDLNGGRVSSALSLSSTTFASGDLVLNDVNLSQINFSALSWASYKNTSNILNHTTPVVAYINAKSSATGVTATAYNVYKGSGSIISGVTNGALNINNILINATTSPSDLVDKINTQVSGVTAVLNTDGSITLSNATGLDIVIAGTVTNTGFTAGTYTGYVSLSNSDPSEDITWSASSSNSANRLRNLGFVQGHGADILTGGTVTTALVSAGEDIRINGIALGPINSDTPAAKAAEINTKTALTGVSAAIRTVASFAVDFANNPPLVALQLTINGATIGAPVTDDITGLVNVINAAGISGVIASASTTGQLILTSESGATISFQATGGAAQLFGLGAGIFNYRANITLTDKNGDPIRLEGSRSSLLKLGFVSSGGTSVDLSSNLGLDVSSINNANRAINRIDHAIASIQSSLGHVGAAQSRFQSAIAYSEVTSQNLSSAKSRIIDADFAAETAALTKAQILQQVGIAILAQANAQMQSVLSLLH